MIGSNTIGTIGGAQIGQGEVHDNWAWNTIVQTARPEMAPFHAGVALPGTEPLTAMQARRLNEMYPCAAPPPRVASGADRVRNAPHHINHSLVQATSREDGMFRESQIPNGTNHELSAYEAHYLNVYWGFLPSFSDFTP